MNQVETARLICLHRRFPLGGVSPAPIYGRRRRRGRTLRGRPAQINLTLALFRVLGRVSLHALQVLAAKCRKKFTTRLTQLM